MDFKENILGIRPSRGAEEGFATMKRTIPVSPHTRRSDRKRPGIDGWREVHRPRRLPVVRRPCSRTRSAGKAICRCTRSGQGAHNPGLRETLLLSGLRPSLLRRSTLLPWHAPWLAHRRPLPSPLQADALQSGSRTPPGDRDRCGPWDDPELRLPRRWPCSSSRALRLSATALPLKPLHLRHRA